jgi:hypothetical protein
MFSLLVSGALAATAQGSPITGEDIRRGTAEAIGRGRATEAVSDCPEIGRDLRGSAGSVTCGCPAIDRDMLGTSVWGNRVYTDDSNICLAAIHDGRVTTSGGRITVWTAPGQARYDSATRNGITSWDYSDFEASIRFTPTAPRIKARPGAEAPEAAPAGPGGTPPPAPSGRLERAEPVEDAPRATHARRSKPSEAEPVDIDTPEARRVGAAIADCPEIGNSLRGSAAPLTCGCPAIARDMVGTSVWGDKVYTDDSSICLAAIHDGRISLSGGRVTVWAAPGRAVYRSTTRNGITSIAYRDFEGSIRFTPPTRRAR